LLHLLQLFQTLLWFIFSNACVLLFTLQLFVSATVKKWSSEEKKIFNSNWQASMGTPTRAQLERLAKLLPGRTIAVLRARAHNILKKSAENSVNFYRINLNFQEHYNNMVIFFCSI
jgi:hypothetical protein